MVKRLRHRPLTAGSRVRIPMGSPKTRPRRPYGQAAKTPPFHGGIPGSNPGRVIGHIWPGSSVGLECQPVTLEVVGSSPIRVVLIRASTEVAKRDGL